MKTHAQLAYEAFLGHPIDWSVVPPATKDLWLKIAAAVLQASEQEHDRS
jgi:hypothetical protein